MIEKLKLLQERSYSPYSRYPVSAIVVMNDGSEFGGVNVENASYGATICAERTAILSAVTTGYRMGDFKELHVMVGSGKIGMPCFVCRQVITEFFDKNAKIYTYNTEGEVEVHTVAELCPYPFGSDDLV
jgi:cytidine deaminase